MTQRALITTGRQLFGTMGYAQVSAEALVSELGLTRGALHHHFGDKAGLFAAVVRDLLDGLLSRLARETMLGLTDHQLELEKGVDILLELFVEPETLQILLKDAPTVLGFHNFERLLRQSGLLTLIEHGLEHWVEAGALEPDRVRPSARLLLGTAVQTALALGDPEQTADKQLYREQLKRVVRGLKAPRL